MSYALTKVRHFSVMHNLQMLFFCDIRLNVLKKKRYNLVFS